MRLRKLAICVLIGATVFNSINIHAYATEEVTAIQEQDDILLYEVTTDNKEEGKVEEDTAIMDQEIIEAVPAKDKEEQTTKETTKEATKEATTKAVTAKEVTAKDATTKEEATKEEATKEEATKEVATKKAAQEETKKVTTETTKEVKKKKEEAKKYTKAQLRLLSALIYCEAQGESYNGKLAVGIVVMNRVRSNKYPNTLKDVIYQKYQFSPVRSGSLKKALSEYDKGKFTSEAEKASIKAAKSALSGTTSLTVNGKKTNFSKYLFFSGRLKGYTYRLGNHQFK